MEVFSRKEELMKAYWLGELEGERLEFVETEWFANDDDAELLEIVRMDLIDDYNSDDLENREKILFEKNFLAGNFDDVALGRYSGELSRQSAKSEKTSFSGRLLTSLKSFGRMPQFAAAAALLLICFAFSAVLLINNFKDEAQTVAEQTPPNENSGDDFFGKPDGDRVQNSPVNDSPKSIENINSGKNAAGRRNEKTINSPNRDLETAKNNEKSEKNQAAKNQIVLLTILRGDLPSRKIPDSAKAITLKLDMPGLEKAYQKYELRILDSGGNTVFRRAIRENLALKKSGEEIIVSSIKTGKFVGGEKYKTVLVGIEKNGVETDLGSYISFEKK